MIGASVPQLSAREKVLGLAQYVGDIKMPGMLHGKVLRSPYPHARICHIDTSRAKALPGVKVVLTGADTPSRKWGLMKKEHRILAAGKVRFAGEEVVALAAVDEATALDALELVRVEYEELPAVFDPVAALEPGAPEVHEGTGNLAFEFHVERGNVEAGFAASAAIYDATYEMGYQYHGYLEPMGTVAAVDANGRVTVWCPTAGIFFARSRLAEALDLPQSSVRVVQTITGGGFGGKNSEDANTPIAALLALKAGRPVRLVNNRLEDFLSARAGLPAKVRLKMGLSKDGEILAKESHIVADNGAYSGLAPAMVHVAAMRSDSMHRLKNVRSHARLAFTNKIPSGAFRGFGNSQMSFPLNSHLAVLAEKIGMDPVEVHLKNAIRTGDTSVHGWKINSGGLSDCIKEASKGIRWGEKRNQAAGTRRRGVGMACAIHVSGNREIADWDGSTVALKVNEDGRATLISGESDVGQGASTVLCQIAAHELGIPVEHVTLNNPDTDVAPYCFGAIASRVTIVAGNATLKAAREAREKLLSVAAEKLEVAVSDLTIENGTIHLIGVPDRKISLADAARLHIFRSGGEAIYTRATWDPPTVMSHKDTHYGNVAPGYSFAAHAVEVEVDTETGQVSVSDSFMADDCGKALNPMAVHGQTSGATAQGIAWALYEAYQFQDGQLVNADFADYTMPTADSLPDLRSLIVESYEPNGPYGAKGASETAVAPPPGAIANAIYDAVGVRINSLPITPEKVLAAMREKNQSEGNA